MKCIICNKTLGGLQKRFCSLKCKNKHGSLKYISYDRQVGRGIKRKLKLVHLKGGKCEICGYKKNLTALTFHHIEPKNKSFGLDSGKIANKKWKDILAEADKCQLLCANCHMEVHHPDFTLDIL